MAIARFFKAREPRGLRLTRVGWWLILMILLLLLPAYWLSVALLYLMAAVLLSLLLYNWLCVVGCLGGVRISIRGASDAFASQPSEVTLLLAHGRRWRRPRHLQVRLESAAMDSLTATVARLSDGDCEVVVAIRPKQRGWLTLDRCTLRLAYPFGLIEEVRRLPLNERLLVYPCPAARHGEALEAVREVQSLVPRSNDDFVYLDTYRPGEDVRLIHWKKSTLSDQPVIRKDLTQLEPVNPRLLILDACPHFEAALSLLTGHFLRAGTAQGWAVLTSAGMVSVQTWEDMAGQLALAQPLQETHIAPYLEQGYELLRLSSLQPDPI